MMRLIVRDQNGNTVGVRREAGRGGEVGPQTEADIEASRVEGVAVKLSDDSEAIILTVTLEESV